MTDEDKTELAGTTWGTMIDRLLNEFGKTPAEIEAAIRATDQELGRPAEETVASVELLRRIVAKRGQT